MRIVNCNEVSEENLEVLGKKAINLKKLIDNKIFVPQFFVLSSEFFNSIGQPNSAGEVLSLDFDRLSDELYKAYVKLGYDPEKVRSAFDLLKSNREPVVAVRAVDSNPNLDTYTNIKGKEELIKAVSLVWASRFSLEANKYWENNLKDANSIIVQKMMLSDKGIVIHSDEEDKLIIRAFWGQTGFLKHVEPDKYIVSESTEQILKKDIGHQRSLFMLDPTHDTFVKKEMPLEAIGSPVLNDGEIFQITQLVKKVRGLLGEVSIEAAFTNGTLFIINIKDNPIVTDSPYVNQFSDQPSDIDDFIGIHVNSSDSPIDAIIDKYIAINPNLKYVFELFRNDLKEVLK